MASKMKVETKGLVMRNGIIEEYVPKEIRSHRDAYAASLSILFKHVADFHLTMIEVLSEKYDLDAGEIIEVVHNDPRIKDMVLHPVINSLGYFEQEDVEKALAKKEEQKLKASEKEDPEVKELREKVTEMLFEEQSASADATAVPAVPPPAKKKILRKKKTDTDS